MICSTFFRLRLFFGESHGAGHIVVDIRQTIVLMIGQIALVGLVADWSQDSPPDYA